MSTQANTAPAAVKAHDVVTIAGKDISVFDLPKVSQIAMLRRGLTHYRGSEQASKVTNWKDDQATVPTDEAIAAKKAEYLASADKALLDGTVGVRVSTGVSRDPLANECRKLAKAQVTKILQDDGVTLPKGEAKVKLTNGEFTFAELIDRRLAKYMDKPVPAGQMGAGKSIMQAAKDAIAAREREAKKATQGQSGDL